MTHLRSVLFFSSAYLMCVSCPLSGSTDARGSVETPYYIQNDIKGSYYIRDDILNPYPFLGDIEYRFSSKRNSFYGTLGKIGTFWLYEPAYYGSLYFLNVGGYNYRGVDNGLNIGIGTRKFLNNGIFGLNLYYDGQESGRFLNQFGAGIEFYSSMFSFYGNVYLPFGDTSFNNRRTVFDDYDGNYVITLTQKEVVAKGFDLNVCGKLYNEFLDLFPSVGIYYSQVRNCSAILGFQASMICRCYHFFSIEPRYTYDKVFRDTFSFALRVDLCFGMPKYITPLANQPFRRNGYIHTRKICRYTTNY